MAKSKKTEDELDEELKQLKWSTRKRRSILNTILLEIEKDKKQKAETKEKNEKISEDRARGCR